MHATTAVPAASLPSPSASNASDGGESDCVKKSRRVFDFSMETLLEYSYLRQDEAARALGVAPITLKRICQRLKYRWPYRMLKAQARREGRRAPRSRKQTEDHCALEDHQAADSTPIPSELFSSPEPEPRDQVDPLPSLCVHLPRLKSLPCRRHLELSHEPRHQPSCSPRIKLPSISSLTAALSQQSSQPPIRLPNLFMTKHPQQRQVATKLSYREPSHTAAKFPLEAQVFRPPEIAAVAAVHLSSSNRRSAVYALPVRSLR